MTLEIKEIKTKEVWNQFLKKFAYTTLFQMWECREFEQSVGSDFRNLGVYENDDLKALLPCKFVKARRGNYLHIRHGFILDWKDQDLVKQVVPLVKQLALENKMWFVRISPLIKNTQENNKILKNLGFIPATTHESDAELTLVVDLRKSEEEILAQMRKNTRYSVRKAEKEGVVVKRATDMSLFSDFELLYNETVSRHKWVGYKIDYIKKEFEAFRKTDSSYMFVAYYKNEPIAAAIFITAGIQAIYHHAGSAAKYKEIPSAYLLHWEAIKFFKSRGLKLYNLWGVCPENNKNHPWYGLSLFKRGFSDKELSFVHAHDLIVSPLAWSTRIYEWLETKKRGYR